MEIVRVDTGARPGFRDRFGERHAGIDTDGRAIELLTLSRSFIGSASALSDRIVELGGFDRPSVARALRLDRDSQSGALILVSERAPGSRLSELLSASIERSVVADLGVSLYLMRQLLATADALRIATGVSHLGVVPERIVITPRGRAVMIETALSVVEPQPAAPTSISEIALVGVSLMIGRQLDPVDALDPLSPVLQDVADVAAIRAGDPFSNALRLWFDRAVVNDPSHAFPDPGQARLALEHIKLPADSGCFASRRTLKAFLAELGADNLTDPEAAALESDRLGAMRARQVASRNLVAARHFEEIARKHLEHAKHAGDSVDETLAPAAERAFEIFPESAFLAPEPADQFAEEAASAIVPGDARMEVTEPVREVVDEWPTADVSAAEPMPTNAENVANATVEEGVAAEETSPETLEEAARTAPGDEEESAHQVVEDAFGDRVEEPRELWPAEEPEREQPAETFEERSAIIESDKEEAPPVANKEQSHRAWVLAITRQLGLSDDEEPAATAETVPEAVAEDKRHEKADINVEQASADETILSPAEPSELSAEPWQPSAEPSQPTEPSQPAVAPSQPSIEAAVVTATEDASRDEREQWIEEMREQLGLTHEEPIAASTQHDTRTAAAEVFGEAAHHWPGDGGMREIELPGGTAKAVESPVAPRPTPPPADHPDSWSRKGSRPLRNDEDIAAALSPPIEAKVYPAATELTPVRMKRRRMVARTGEVKRGVAIGLTAGIIAVSVVAAALFGRTYYIRATAPGTVVVESTPRGSQVLIDGISRGLTPVTFIAKPGEHVLELRRNGVARQFTIKLEPGGKVSHRLNWSTVKEVGSLAVTSAPAGAKVIVDGKEHGVTPLSVSDLAAGTHTVVLESSSGTVRRQVKISDGAEARLDETIISGWVAVFAPFELQIYERKRLIGTTEQGRIMVPSGSHELELVNTRLGFREVRTVEVPPGEAVAVNITKAVGGIIRVTAPPGAEVWLDGARIGLTPLGDVAATVGTHEIVVRHPDLGERRLTTTVSASAPSDVLVR